MPSSEGRILGQFAPYSSVGAISEGGDEECDEDISTSLYPDTPWTGFACIDPSITIPFPIMYVKVMSWSVWGACVLWRSSTDEKCAFCQMTRMAPSSFCQIITVLLTKVTSLVLPYSCKYSVKPETSCVDSVCDER